MRNGIVFNAVISAVLASFVHPPHLAGQTGQSNTSTGVLTLDDAVSNLSKIISRGKVTVSAGAGHTFSDFASVYRGEWSQSNVLHDKKLPCLISWDERTFLHYANDPSAGEQAGKTTVSGERHFLWLAYVIPAEVKIFNLKTWANDDNATDSSVPQSANGIYSGFVLTTKHSMDVIAIYPLKSAFPNPSSFKKIGDSDRIFFATRQEAEDAEKLLLHAISAVTDQDGITRCIRR